LSGELGDLLFAVINLSRRLGIDPNMALSKTNAKFEKRFRYIEQHVEKLGGDWKKFSLDELESFWKEAKKSAL
ncbi:MAG: nucleoside triphosphate pyrophosphohydrolase, partial [Pyramidobacter sp.]|nr:nucleoside triphosphate pyrophosphohydrolase [Pyramidobacter sp.]